MPEQYIITRAYLRTVNGKSTYTPVVMEEILSILEVHLVTKEEGSITRLNSRVKQLTNVRGGLKWYTETNWRLVCSDTYLMRVMRRPQSYYRQYLTGTQSEALLYLTYEMGAITLSRFRSSPEPTWNVSYDG